MCPQAIYYICINVTNKKKEEKVDDLERKILDYVVEEYVEEEDEDEVSVETPLISSGLVDSFSMTSLKSYLEREFDITISDEEADTDTFDKIENIAKLVKSKLD